MPVIIFMVHGGEWLANPAVSLAFLAASLCLLAAAIALKRRRSPTDFNVMIRGFGHRIIRTNDAWLLFTGFLVLAALGAHFLAEYVLHLYDVTDIDRFTHGLSGMAVTAIVLNFYLTRKRRVYYPVGIGASWVAFVLWEVYEGIALVVDPGSAMETDLEDMLIDLWIDTLGALSICFIHDEFVHDEDEKAIDGNKKLA